MEILVEESGCGSDSSAAPLSEESREDDKVLTGTALLNGTLTEERITQAESLCMIGGVFDDFAAKYVASTVFPKTRRLRVVDLAHTQITPTDLRTILHALERSPAEALEQLSFRDMNLHNEECDLICRVMLKHASQLKRLELQHCHVNDTAAQAVAEGVAQAEALVEARLADNNIIPAFAIPLEESRWLFFPSSLKLLDVSGNRIESVHTCGLSVSLSRCAASLEELYMSRCCVTESLLTTLLRVGFHSSHSLRVLNVSSGRLLHTAGKVLCSVLSECPNLERLYVQGNFIEADGAAQIALGIPCAKRLAVLGLGSCHLSGVGVQVIAEAAHKCSSLRELDFSNNSVTDADVFHICARREDSSLMLSFLDLSDNPLSELCRPALEALLRRNKTGSCTVLVRGTALGADLSYLRCDNL
ncbi:putative leucine-rich repeat protein (LRRP) [Trypanosoma rangeli]|uniref:Putative leucine-rich repeat protein (LRRP) n=1 Tax=Trypanosoma rangeli TaxID=5698 RepID=A0A3R7NVI2_TRYRA|nr:putative leucine-rich repeat protein (LRRP) [Trypanosoma rangeli]RNF12460.1 putative leucine-rich repeat protein (LRRP) [Trypanosoma rangeli]|eukprot:RNF12460.1 putative leucine-rich repeat protein (LRRP) [Trypanosoma rangeli]